MNEYKYDDENHIHLILDNGEYKPLIGTSSMSSVLVKPGLTYWAAGLALQPFGWIKKKDENGKYLKKEIRLSIAKNRRKEIETDYSDEDYLKLLDEAYSAHATKLKDSAEAGTEMHTMMEEYIKDSLERNEGKPFPGKANDPKLQILIDWSRKNVKRFLWSEVNCYSRDFWLGGISDCGFEDNEGKFGILDFKSSKDVYTSQFWQCVGYAIQLEENGGFTPDGEKVLMLHRPIDYVAILPFGMKKPEVKYYHEMKQGKKAVRSMLTLYQMLNKNGK